MPTVAEALQTAVSHHQAGRLPQAAQIYQQILQAEPSHAQAMHLLGVVAHQTGQHERAIALISNSIRLVGNQPAAHRSLGEAYRACGKLAEAKACYLKAISLQPNLPEPYYHLALVHYAEKDSQSAISRCRQAVALRPDYVQALNDLGNMLRESGQESEAQGCYERAVASQLNYFDALVNLGSLFRQRRDYDTAERYLLRALDARPTSPDVPMLLGDLETARERWSEAIGWYRKSLEIEPNSHRVETRLGAALQGDGQIDAAIDHYRRAIQLNGDVAETHFNLGVALESQGRVEEAVAQYETTLRLEPSYAGAHVNLGAYWQEQGEPQRGLAHYNRVLELRPESAEAHYNRALILLRNGDFAAGWPDYEWRYRLPKFPLEVMKESMWDGSDLGERTLLVHAEQGVGDALHFIRFIPLVQRRCPNIIMRVHPPVVSVLRQSGFSVLGHDEPLPHFDVQVPLMSLPGMLGTNLTNIPAPIPYLSAKPELIDEWRERLKNLSGFRVGICWQGSRENKSDRARSMALAHFEPLVRVAGVQLISLQKKDGVEQIAELAGRFPVAELGDDLDEEAGPFMDTAAVMKNLDLVITADTSIAHLAGGLGVSVWVALSTRADWRWMLDREDTPWYPTMRLFRQTRFGEWNDVFEWLAASLAELAGGTAR